MGTLSSELRHALERMAGAPRVYADANVPAGLVTFLRRQLGWDVFFVMEQPDLRRAPDEEHFRLARQMHRTLVTLDRDYLDDDRFPPARSSGVVVVSAPDERAMAKVLGRVDRHLLRGASPECRPPGALPLTGQKVHAHLDWPPGPEDAPTRRQRPRGDRSRAR